MGKIEKYFFVVVRNKLQTLNMYKKYSKEDQKFRKRKSQVNVLDKLRIKTTCHIKLNFFF